LPTSPPLFGEKSRLRERRAELFAKPASRPVTRTPDGRLDLEVLAGVLPYTVPLIGPRSSPGRWLDLLSLPMQATRSHRTSRQQNPDRFRLLATAHRRARGGHNDAVADCGSVFDHGHNRSRAPRSKSVSPTSPQSANQPSSPAPAPYPPKAVSYSARRLRLRGARTKTSDASSKLLRLLRLNGRCVAGVAHTVAVPPLCWRVSENDGIPPNVVCATALPACGFVGTQRPKLSRAGAGVLVR